MTEAMQEIRRLKEELEATEASHQDEEAAHANTLRLLALRDQEIEQLKELLKAYRLVHIEARDLVGEADATGVVPQANVNALRSLLYRVSIKDRATSCQNVKSCQPESDSGGSAKG